MHFLDQVPIHRDDPHVEQLVEVLIQAYDEEYDALALAGQVGLLKADIERYPKLRLTWWSIIEESSKEGQLRRLIDKALNDPTRENWHMKIREVVDVQGSLVDDAPAAKPKTNEEKRKAAKAPEIGSSANLWGVGSTLHVRFLNGSKRLRSKVEAAAMQWVEYANLKLEFGDNADAPIRVSFQEDGASWSYLGRQALALPGKNPTVNFGWLKDSTPKDEIERVVIHEFGHVLGLQHEHGNPASTLKWRKDEVYRVFSGPPNLWDRPTIDNNIFAIWPPSYFPLQKVFDRDSIMIHEMPKNFFADGKPIERNGTLSAVDKQFAAALYPLRPRGTE